MARFRDVSPRARRILNGTAWIVGLNFVAFLAVGAYLGGDALNGYVDKGQYYVCWHSKCYEVSKTLWNYSWWHAISTYAGILLVFGEVGYFIRKGDIVLDFTSRT
jgi:glycerol uptake facilitator-like aquaporin